MAEDPRPPVAIRVTRPYESEDDLLAHEPETLTRTSITLLGAQSRPQGVILRFELALAAGQVLLRGEGRVVGYRASSKDALGALTLRFTRLDTRSKALVDKAAALRDPRRAGPPVAVEDVALRVYSPPAPFPPSASFAPPASFVSSGSFGPPPFEVSPVTLPPVERVAGEPAQSPPARRPPDRDALLDRLRVRAQEMTPHAVRDILEPRGRSRT